MVHGVGGGVFVIQNLLFQAWYFSRHTILAPKMFLRIISKNLSQTVCASPSVSHPGGQPAQGQLGVQISIETYDWNDVCLENLGAI